MELVAPLIMMESLEDDWESGFQRRQQDAGEGEGGGGRGRPAAADQTNYQTRKVRIKKKCILYI